jgi:transposase
MFIKKIIKKNRTENKEFIYYRLTESYRTAKGPRHRTILNLGKLEIPESKFKMLADRIEDILYGQKNIFNIESEIETLAHHYAGLISGTKIENNIIQEENNEEYYNIDINSIENTKVRTIGAEYVGLSYYKKLGIDDILRQLDFTEEQQKIAAMLIIGRLVKPGSELATINWARNLSGLEELLGGKSFKRIKKDKFYKVSDKIFTNREKIEKELNKNAVDLFGLEEKIILYDLTNTYFEGKNYSSKISHGRSKEKRSDCKIITLGLVIDENGFAKKSEFFSGNVSEPKTLEIILNKLESKGTVIIDAGIATKDNLKMIKEKGYNYLCVARGDKISSKISKEGLLTIKDDGRNRIDVKMEKIEGETVLFCKSKMKMMKEMSMLETFKTRFEQGLESLKSSINKPRGIKNYDKIQERIGRLKEKSHGIWQYYNIEVKKDEKNIATQILYSYNSDDAVSKYDGSYSIRTNRTDLSEKEIWDLYITLNGIEDSFKSLKEDLGVRPIFHRNQDRIEGHIFITVLAYQILNAIRFKLREKYIVMKWRTVRDKLSNIVISTTSMKTKDSKKIYIRHHSKLELIHKEIFESLGISQKILQTRKLIV